MNEKAKNWFGKHKWHIVCGIVSAVLIVGCALNIYYACKSGSDANIFTAIGGWVGFLATAGIGIITLLQNRKYEQRAYKQYKIDNLYRAREIIYSDDNQFSSSKHIVNAVVASVKVDDGQQQFNFEIKTSLKFLADQCENNSKDLYNLRYNFGNAIELFELLSRVALSTKRIIINGYTKEEFEKCANLYDKAKQKYFDLLIEIDDTISEFMEKNLSYKDFEKGIEELESIEDKCEKMSRIIETIREEDKETQNGQAEDDVDGQGK